MNGQNCFNCFDLDNNSIHYQKIKAISAIKLYSLVFDRKWTLLFEFYLPNT